MLRMTRPDGLVLVSCATYGRKEHGTSRTNPDASPFTSAAKWDYYRNLRARDIAGALNLDGWLSDHGSWVNHITKDLYFIGLRHGSGGKLDAGLRERLDPALRDDGQREVPAARLEDLAARRPAVASLIRTRGHGRLAPPPSPRRPARERDHR